MKRFGFIAVLLLMACSLHAQGDQYIVKLKDKVNSPFSISRPQEFLSQRAIDRRQKQLIPIVENDLPVNPSYLDSIKNSGNVKIRNVSKWLNQVLIETTDPAALNKINGFSFVINTQLSRRIAGPGTILRKKWNNEFKKIEDVKEFKGVAGYNYGFSEGQIKIHHGDFLHDKGFSGQGMLIAVIDDGFYHYQTLPAFDSLRADGRIKDMYDFVDNKVDMNSEDAHGMYCLSLIASNVPGQMIGTAPHASFLLYRSENIYSESISEEQNWIAAAERSDSAGADVITTSLGYYDFDNPIFNHSYQDMDGKTTIIARGADVAASKGMIVLAAAGNEGNKTWHYIITPADAINILTVGAVDVNGVPGLFTSYGPSFDGRIKPDVASVGVSAVVQSAGGPFLAGNGTSFATPNLAGLVTCLWQAFPEFTSAEIMDVVKKSSSQYTTPDDRVGYGIPDFEIAYNALQKLRVERTATALLADKKIFIYPNPGVAFTQVLLRPATTGSSELRLYDITGKLCYRKAVAFSAGQVSIITLERNSLPVGTYILHFADGKNKYSEKLVWR